MQIYNATEARSSLYQLIDQIALSQELRGQGLFRGF